MTVVKVRLSREKDYFYHVNNLPFDRQSATQSHYRFCIMLLVGYLH